MLCFSSSFFLTLEAKVKFEKTYCKFDYNFDYKNFFTIHKILLNFSTINISCICYILLVNSYNTLKVGFNERNSMETNI